MLHVTKDSIVTHILCNKGNGCTWQGEVNDIFSHHDSKDGCHNITFRLKRLCDVTVLSDYITNSFAWSKDKGTSNVHVPHQH